MQHNLCHLLTQQPKLGKPAYWPLAVDIYSDVLSEVNRVRGDTV
jgi:hypothetical protein